MRLAAGCRWLAAALLTAALSLPAGARAADYSDMVIDVNSGQILHQTSADAPRFPASLAKMMTLYIVFDMVEKHRLSLDTMLTISDYDASAQPSKLGLKTGETISVSDAIKALVTASANDVARAIAENLGGDEDKFAKYMTWQAHKLGMLSTTYRNASGLPDPEQTTTARDYVTLSLHLHDDFPQFFGMFKTEYFAWGRARYRNHNGLLFNFPGAEGIKTGYTRMSGFNLAESVHRGNKHVIGVIFGGRSVGERNSRMRDLLTAGLAKSSAVATRVPAKPYVEVAAKAVPIAKTVLAAVTTDIKVAAGIRPKAADGAPAKRVAQKTTDVPPEPTDDQAAPDQAGAPGPFNVQIGAFETEVEARHKLSATLGSASDVLAGHAPVAVVYNDASKVWYRARFAGFERPQADQACTLLKSKHIACIVMRAD